MIKINLICPINIATKYSCIVLDNMKDGKETTNLCSEKKAFLIKRAFSFFCSSKEET